MPVDEKISEMVHDHEARLQVIEDKDVRQERMVEEVRGDLRQINQSVQRIEGGLAVKVKGLDKDLEAHKEAHKVQASVGESVNKKWIAALTLFITVAVVLLQFLGDLILKWIEK